MSKHTPGPWFIGDANIPWEYTHGIHAGDFIVADLCDNGHTPETRKANAKLIVAAPELLEALKGMIEHFWIAGSESEFDAIKKAREAIAKAVGKQ